MSSPSPVPGGLPHPVVPHPPRAPWARLRLRLFGLPYEELLAERRGFRVSGSAAVEHQARIAGAFWVGYHAALADPGPEAIRRRTQGIERGWRGYAYEGVGMAVSRLDHLTPRLGRPPGSDGPGQRLGALLASPARAFRYVLYLGLGFTLARRRLRPVRVLEGLDPLCRWLVFDGFGFHDGFFAAGEGLDTVPVPPRLTGYARRSFDQGLGRSLWFARGMDAEAVAGAVAAYPEPRRGDLWAGVGLAATTAGGAPPAVLLDLASRSGPWRAHLLQGAVFAAVARLEADDPAPHTDEACRALCGAGAAELATLCREVARDLPDDGGSLDAPEPSWEVWRRRVRAALGERAGRDAGRSRMQGRETRNL